MEYNKLKSHRGYLLIVSVMVIVVVALIGTLVVGMFTGGIKSTGEVAQSNSAFYFATSGLQVAKRDIIVSKIGCIPLNGRYVNASLPNFLGRFTVNSCLNKAVGTLNSTVTATQNTIPVKLPTFTNGSLTGAITDTATTIPFQLTTYSRPFRSSGSVLIDAEFVSYNELSGNNLIGVTRGVGGTIPIAHNVNAPIYQGFLQTNGIVMIDNEIIYYKNVTGDLSSVIVLQNATRGFGNTAPATHNSDADVVQAECILTSTAAFPDLEGKRIIKEEILGTDSTSFIYDSFKPAIVSVGNVTLQGDAHINNMTVTRNDLDFAGSTILTAGTLTLESNQAHTQFSPIAGETLEQARSNKTIINADIQTGYTGITKSTLFSSIFNVPFNQISPTVTIAADQLLLPGTSVSNNAIVYVPSTLNVNNSYIASGATKILTPKMLIINGDLNVSGNGYTLIFGDAIINPTSVIVTGNVTGSGGPDKTVTINGIVYSMGNINVAGTLNFNVNGFTASEGTSSFGGTSSIELNPKIIDIIKDSGIIVTNYAGTAYKAEEIFR